MIIKIHEMSFSGLQTYLMCPLKFKYGSIDKVQPEFTPQALAFGSAVHDALDSYYKSGQLLTVDMMVNILRNGLADETIKLEYDLEELIYEGRSLLTQAIAMPVGTIIGTEVPVEIPVTNDFTIIGRIDMISEENGQTVITDFKTASKKPSQKDVDANLQLTTYSIAYPNSIQRIRALIKSSSAHTLDLSTSRTDADRSRVIKMFTGVKDAIESGAFYPCESWACSGCQYYKHCHKEY